MNKTLYVCRSCGYGFPKELSELIENKTQVYCEMCGTPFSLAGIRFKQSDKSTPIHPKSSIREKKKSKLEKAIISLDKFDYVPMAIFSIIVFVFNSIYRSGENNLFIASYLLVFISVLIIVYDSKSISSKIKSDNYDEIALDGICYGILGCFIYGTGVLILIKGILILIYSIKKHESNDHKLYNFGLKLKNSINNFSAKAGFVIVLLVLYGTFSGRIDIYCFRLHEGIFFLDTYASILLFLLIPFVVLIIDSKLKVKIREKQEFTGRDALRTFILGAIGTAFLNIGIFILLKSILLFLLFVGKPIDLIEKPRLKEKESEIVPVQKGVTKEPIVEIVKKEELHLVERDNLPPEPGFQVISAEKELPSEEKEVKVIEEGHKKEKLEEQPPKLKEKKKKEKEIKFRLHESLLPVKNEKDRKVVKEYFSKIFSIISKDLRKQISELDIPKKQRKEILEELAFLAEEEQLKYIGALRKLYETIPEKLIERICKLQNVKPEYYDKIVEQLKYLDSEEQIEFVVFLEKNA
jgi:DNA-directed RNA polymerase subunit RPC12/RpoP